MTPPSNILGSALMLGSGGGGGATEYVINTSTSGYYKEFDLSSAGLSGSDLVDDGKTFIWIEVLSVVYLHCCYEDPGDDSRTFPISLPAGAKFACTNIYTAYNTKFLVFAGAPTGFYGFFTCSVNGTGLYFDMNEYDASSSGFVESRGYNEKNGPGADGPSTGSMALHVVKLS